MKVAFRFGHSQVQNELRPWISGKISGVPPSPPARLPNGDEHAFWILSNANYFDPAKFNIKEQGTSWLNEVEGLINQKCPEVDLRVENVLTNQLFPTGPTGPGGMKVGLNFS